MPAGIAVQLGSVSLANLEVTSSIQFGGEQRLIVHRLMGGGRVVDVLGRDEREIGFSGVFTGSEATSRARQIDYLRTGGATLPLSWDVFFYSVVIKDFCADYTNAFWIPFSIRCTVIRDEGAPAPSYVVSVAASIETDLANAASAALQGGLQLMLPITGVASQMTLQSAQTQVTNARSSLQQSWDAGALDTASTASGGITALQNTTNATHSLANFTVANGYLERAMGNSGNLE